MVIRHGFMQTASQEPATDSQALLSWTSFPLFLKGPEPPEDPLAKGRGSKWIREADNPCLACSLCTQAAEVQGLRSHEKQPSWYLDSKLLKVSCFRIFPLRGEQQMPETATKPLGPRLG